jgi:hypothetical protein
MGWLISYDLTKQQQVAELVAGWSNEKGGCRFLAHSVRGNVLFAVGQNFVRDEPEKFEDRWIMVCLLRKDRGMGWGYKDMDESMGPVEVGCPLSYLDMAPCPNEWGQKWRERVRAYHAKRKAQKPIQPGDKIRFKPGLRVLGEEVDDAEYIVTRKNGRGYIVQMGFMPVKIMRKHIAEHVPAE